MRYEEALTDLINYHKANGRDIAKHLTPFFAGKRMMDITTAMTNAYVARLDACG